MRLDKEHTTCLGKLTWAAEKVFDASYHILTSNPKPTNIQDWQTVAD